MTKMYHYVCEQCKKEFDLPYKKRCKHIYCSHECAGLAKRKGIEKTCPVCKSKFYVSPSNIDQICCKKECITEYMRGKPNYGERKYKFLETKAMDNHLYRKWRSLKNRLFRPSCERYKNYAGRGISICDEWLNFENFYDWAMNSGYQEGLTIERINVNGNYCPENCTWIPMSEQAKNRTTNIRVLYNGQETILSEVAKAENLNYKSLLGYYHRTNDINIAISKAKPL